MNIQEKSGKLQQKYSNSEISDRFDLFTERFDLDPWGLADLVLQVSKTIK